MKNTSFFTAKFSPSFHSGTSYGHLELCFLHKRSDDLHLSNWSDRCLILTWQTDIERIKQSVKELDGYSIWYGFEYRIKGRWMDTATEGYKLLKKFATKYEKMYSPYLDACQPCQMLNCIDASGGREFTYDSRLSRYVLVDEIPPVDFKTFETSYSRGLESRVVAYDLFSAQEIITKRLIKRLQDGEYYVDNYLKSWYQSDKQMDELAIDPPNYTPWQDNYDAWAEPYLIQGLENIQIAQAQAEAEAEIAA